MTDTTPSAFTVAESGCYTKIRYRVRVENGPVLKGAVDPEIMDFITGYAQVVPGLEKRLLGHAVGEKLSFTVPPEEAFGPRHKELVIEKKREDFHFPEGMTPWVGMEIPLITNHPDAPESVHIREIREDTIVIDLNHPLSGAALQYDLEIIEARPARHEEICGEWQEQSTGGTCDGTCSGHAPTIVLGQEETEH